MIRSKIKIFEAQGPYIKFIIIMVKKNQNDTKFIIK